jgi:hypothetical protein
MPRLSRTDGGVSAIHSPTASREAAPVRTAYAVSAGTTARACRTPRGSRGSGTSASRSSRPGISSAWTGKLTRAYRPQTNGKVERFHRTLLDEWAYLRPYTSNTERTEALADFLHTYNHHRCHTALGGQPPISRVNNAAAQYS